MGKKQTRLKIYTPQVWRNKKKNYIFAEVYYKQELITS